jgi:hypothetical protein
MTGKASQKGASSPLCGSHVISEEMKNFFESRFTYEDWLKIQDEAFTLGNIVFVEVVSHYAKSNMITKANLLHLRSCLVQRLMCTFDFKYDLINRNSVALLATDVLELAHANSLNEKANLEAINCLRATMIQTQRPEEILLKVLDKVISLSSIVTQQASVIASLTKENEDLKAKVDKYKESAQQLPINFYYPIANKNKPAHRDTVDSDQSVSKPVVSQNVTETMLSQPTFSSKLVNNINSDFQVVGATGKASGWKRVNNSSKQRDKRSKTLMTGSSDMDTPDSLRMVPKKFHYKIGRFEKSTTKEQVAKMIENVIPSGKFTVSDIPTRHDYGFYKIFQVSIESQLKDDFLDPGKWSKGIEIQRFFFRKSSFERDNTPNSGGIGNSMETTTPVSNVVTN